MRLAVFEDPSGDLLVQVSAPDLPVSRWLFAAAARLPNALVARMSRSEYVEIPFGEEKIAVFFLVIASVPRLSLSKAFEKSEAWNKPILSMC